MVGAPIHLRRPQPVEGVNTAFVAPARLVIWTTEAILVRLSLEGGAPSILRPFDGLRVRTNGWEREERERMFDPPDRRQKGLPSWRTVPMLAPQGRSFP